MMMVVKRGLQRVRLTIMISRVSFPSRFWHCSTPKLTEFRQQLQVQSHLEMPRILVQLGHTQRT